MALILERLADTLALLRESLRDDSTDDVAVWMDDEHLYMEALLPHLDGEGLDLSLQAGRLFVTATPYSG